MPPKLSDELRRLLEQGVPDAGIRERLRRAIESSQVAAQQERTEHWEKSGGRTYFDHLEVRTEIFRLMDAKGDFAGAWQMRHLRSLVLDFINAKIARTTYAPKPDTGRLQLRNVVKDWRIARASQSSQSSQ